jgi:hypothetical protein
MRGMAHLGKVLGVAAVLLAPLPALAQAYQESYEPGVRRYNTPPSGHGQTVMLGGGVMAFSGDTARSVAESGGAWDLRFGWGTRSTIGTEAAYIGSVNKLTAAGLDDGASLLGTGAEGALRLNIPLVYRDSLFEPFGLAGLGWTRFDVVNNDINLSRVREKDHVMTVPVGAGLAAALAGFMVDARFTYRFTYYEDLIGNADLDNWIVSANLGAEF